MNVTQRFQRRFDQDTPVGFHNLVMQIERAEWRPALAECEVILKRGTADWPQFRPGVFSAGPRQVHRCRFLRRQLAPDRARSPPWCS